MKLNVPFINKIPENLRDMYKHDFISGIYWGVYGTIALVLGPFILIKYYNLNNYLVSLIISGPLLGMLFSPLISELIKHTKKKPIMTFLAVLGRGLLLLIALPISPVMISVVFALGGFISALTFPVYSQVLKLNYTDEFRGRAMSYVRVGISASTILFSVITGYILSYYPHLVNYLFAFSSLFGILAAWEFNKIHVNTDEKYPNISFAIFKQYFKIKNTYLSIKKILSENKLFKKFIIIYSIFNVGMSMINPLIPIYFNGTLKLNYNIAGIILGVFPFIAGLITYIIWGKIIDKYNPLTLLSITFFMAAVGTFIFPLFNLLYTAATAVIIFSIVRVGFDILGITSILYFCLPEESGIYMGLNLVFAGLIGAVIPYITIFMLGFIKIEIIFYIASIFMIFASLLMIMLYKKNLYKLKYNM